MPEYKFPTGDIKFHGQVWQDVQEVVPAGIPLSVVMTRDYWVHRNKLPQLMPGTVVWCRSESGDYDACIRMLYRTPSEFKFHILFEAPNLGQGEAVKAEAQDRYVVQHRGRAGGWGVREKATGELIADGLDKVTAEAEKARLEETRKAA